MAEHLSNDLLRELRQKLIDKKNELENAKKLLEEEDSYSDPDRTVGNAELEEEAEEDRSHLETEMELDNVQETLDLVDRALSKFEDGTYGICEESGHPISAERLKANPEALYCIKHADEEEQQKQQE